MIKDKLDFPIFELTWTAHDELKLLQGVSKSGIDNWYEVQVNFLPDKELDDIEAHFYSCYNIFKNSEYKEEGLCEIIANSPRDKNGRFTVDDEASQNNEILKAHMLNLITEQNQKIYSEMQAYPEEVSYI